MNATKQAVLVAGATISVAGAAEKSKQWQRELLMERIRSRSPQHKSYTEMAKSMRMTMLEKRYALDAVEKANLQKCLDSMQYCIKVTTRQGLVERLESLSRQLGLKFMEDTSGLFISTDMFFLEIILDASGALTDVKVHHECKIEQQSCSELVNCLNRGDFADFTIQLEGLSSIYQLNAEPKVKTKAFVALQAIETDLHNLYQMQNFSKETMLTHSIVGLVLKRRGGHPMKLTYFVPPYDLISLETKAMQALSIELIVNQAVGFSVTVNLEASSANKLQILPTVTSTKDATTDEDMPVYAPLTQLNSMMLPATFVLRLNKSMPVCYNTLRNLNAAMGNGQDGVTVGLESQHKPPPVLPIMNLIIQTASEQKLRNSQKGLFVCLPDQTHCYFFTENNQLKAAIISSIPFTEPAQVPKILEFLKQQALFYTLLSSCVRMQSKMGNDMDTTIILEVNAISFQQISVSLQHPYEESMITVEVDLHNPNRMECCIYGLNQSYDTLSRKLVSVLQQSLSIPLTIRALLKYWEKERQQVFQRNIGIGSAGNGSCSTAGGTSGNGSNGGGNGGGSLAEQSPGSVSAGTMGSYNMLMGSSSSGSGNTEPNGRGGNGSGNGNGNGGGNGNGSGNGLSGGPVAVEPAVHPLPLPPCKITLPVALAGFLKFPADAKAEVEHTVPSPKEESVPEAIEATVTPHTLEPCLTFSPQTSTTSSSSATVTAAAAAAAAAALAAASIEIVDKYKNIWKEKTPNLKNCVSITPIPIEPALPAQSLDVKRGSAIEIIPLTGQGNVASPVVPTTTATPTTITITPINTTPVGDEKKTAIFSAGSSTTLQACTSAPSAGTKRSIDAVVADVQKEKKRKRKRDDSPMGPPASTSDGSAPAGTRKFSSPSSSPKGSSGGLVSSTTSSSITARPSPKHSPVYSSPKHNTASNSPKSPFSTHSPKHGSSGKPCMSTLKSAAATSLSPKSSSDKCSSNSISGIVTAPVTTTTTNLTRPLPTSTGSSSSSSSGSSGSSSGGASGNSGSTSSGSSSSSGGGGGSGGSGVGGGGGGGGVSGLASISLSAVKAREKEKLPATVVSTTTSLPAVPPVMLKPTLPPLPPLPAMGVGAGQLKPLPPSVSHLTTTTAAGIELSAALPAMRKTVTSTVNLMTPNTTATTAPLTTSITPAAVAAAAQALRRQDQNGSGSTSTSSSSTSTGSSSSSSSSSTSTTSSSTTTATTTVDLAHLQQTPEYMLQAMQEGGAL